MSDTEHEPVSALDRTRVAWGARDAPCHLRSNSRTHVCDCLLHYAFAGRGLIVRHVKKKPVIFIGVTSAGALCAHANYRIACPQLASCARMSCGQSRLLRANRETSRAATAPTLPRQTCATIRSKPARWTLPAAERPRSSSITSISDQPSVVRRSRMAYCSALLSRLCRT